MYGANISNANNDVFRGKKEHLLEIEFNGKVRFDFILKEVSSRFGIIYRIVSADIEFCGNQNIGTMKLRIEANREQVHELQDYLNAKRLLSSFVEVV